MYAIFSIRKLTATSRLNAAQVQLMMLDDQQYAIATQKLDLQSELSAKRQASAEKQASMYEHLADASDGEKDSINAEIAAAQKDAAAEEEVINQKTYALAKSENAIEVQKKALETQITKWSKELEQIEKAEADGIERANPKYSGLG